MSDYNDSRGGGFGYEGRGDRGDRGDRMDRGGDDERGGRFGRGFRRRRVCRFCSEKDAVIDYRDVGLVRMYISERGKIVPRRISGNCSKHQRAMAAAVKRARMLALIPFTITGT